MLDLHSRISAAGGWAAVHGAVVLDEAYVDECQDATMAELLLLLRMTSDPNRLFLTGDTAQAIARGVAFRFEDVTAMIFALKEDEAAARELRLAKPVAAAQSEVLAQNFRAHTGVLNAAASVVFALRHFFPNSIDNLPPDKGIFDGPRPSILLTTDIMELRALLGGADQRGGGPVRFGARQIVIVRNDEARRDLPAFFRGATVLTVSALLSAAA